MRHLFRTVGLLCGLASSLSAASYDYWITGNPADAKPARTRAGLLLSGGGGDVTAAWQWFVACAGGGDIVVLRASGADGYNDYIFSRIGGVDSVESIRFNDASAASDPRVLEIIARADGIFLAGGDQARYVNYWKGTPVGAALNAHLRAGKPLGGTSAGLAVLGQYYFSALEDSITSASALANPFDRKVTVGRDFIAAPALVGVITDSHAINPNFFPKLPYDSLKDFEPVSQLVFVPFVLIAKPALQIKSVGDLIALAKAQPGKLNYASIGNGTPHYLAMEWFKSLSGTDLTHVPYKGVAPAVTDVVAGQVDVMFTGISSGLPHIKAGKLAGLAVSSPKRQGAAPEIPTVSESGLPDFVFMTWYGSAFPAGTPKDIVARMSHEVARALNQPDVRARLAALGVEAAPSTPDEFAAFMKKEAGTYTRIIKTTGAKGE